MVQEDFIFGECPLLGGSLAHGPLDLRLTHSLHRLLALLFRGCHDELSPVGHLCQLLPILDKLFDALQ